MQPCVLHKIECTSDYTQPEKAWAGLAEILEDLNNVGCGEERIPRLSKAGSAERQGGW